MSAAKRDENREVALILQNLLGTSVLYPTGLSLTNATALHVALVDSNGDQVSSFGGGTQYAEDAAHVSGNTGTMALAVRNDTVSALAGTDGDYIPLTTDALGSLRSTPSDTTASGSLTASSQAVTISTEGKGIVSYYLSGTWTATLVAEGTIDGTNWFTCTVEDSDIANGGLMSNLPFTGAYMSRVFGYKQFRLRVSSYTSGTIVISMRASQISPHNHVTYAQDGQTIDGVDRGMPLVAFPNTGSQYKKIFGHVNTNALFTTGDAAHDGIDDGNPMKIGGYASAAAPTNVSADGDRVNGWFLRNGAQATVLTAAGALIGGDAANGLDVDVTRVTGTVTIAGAVTNTGTFAVQESGTQVQVDDAAFIPATSKVVMFGAEFDNVATDSVDEGDGGALRMSANRALYVMLRDNAGNERGLNIDANGAIAVTATNATASNLKVAATLDAETTKVIGTARLLGNGGATLDSTVGAGTAPTNQMVAGAIYNSTEISPTTGQAFALQADSKGRLRGVIMDAAGNTRGANVDASNRLSITLDNIASSLTLGTITTVSTVTNLAQMNGAALLMGNGATGTGSQRVTVASDNSAIALWGHGATGSAVPANGVYMGISDAGTLRGLLQAANALNSTGAGIPTAQMVAQFDDASPTSITENQFGNVRMSANRALYVMIRDNAGNERGLNIDSSGQLAITIAAAQTLATVTTVSTVTNLAQMNGAAITMGNGVSGTGVQRVTIASDSTGQVALAAGSATIGALTANQSVNNAQIGGNTISTGVGATGNGTQRVVVANDAGRTLVSKGGSVASSGDNTLVVAGTNKLKVYAFSLSIVSTTAVTCIFQSGTSGTELWRVILQTPASVAGGANIVVQPPAWLFATASATLLNLNLSAAVTVHYSVSYFDEA